MTIIEASESGLRQRIDRPVLGAACFLAGAVCAVVSFAGLAWYTYSGPSVVYGSVHALTAPSGGPSLLNPSDGSSHSVAAWAVLVACVLAAGSCRALRGSFRPIAQVAAVVLAAVGLLHIALHVVGSRWAVASQGLPPGTSEHLHAGAWLAVAGFALLAASSLMVSRTR